MSSELDADHEGRKKLARAALLRGMPMDKVAEKTGLSVADVQRVQVEHYAQYTQLDEHTMYQKQLERLELVLDKAFQWLEKDYVDPKEAEAILKVLREISELAGLKRKEIVIQQKVLDDKRLDVVATFAQLILTEYTRKIECFFTKRGLAEIEAHGADWQSEIIIENADILDAEIEAKV